VFGGAQREAVSERRHADELRGSRDWRPGPSRTRPVRASTIGRGVEVSVRKSIVLSMILAVGASQTLIPRRATAQGRDTATTPTKLFTDRDARIAGAFAVATVLMFPVDKHFALIS